MDTTGKLVSVVRDIVTGKIMVSFIIDTEPEDELNALAKLDEIDIKAEKHKKKRSLDANGMLWACLSDIAAALHKDKWSTYLDALKDHGQHTYICAEPDAVDSIKKQWRETMVVGEKEVDGKKQIHMLCFFGSSTYDTEEFSKLLEGVISDMSVMGLTPPPSKAMRRALEQWENQTNKVS